MASHRAARSLRRLASPQKVYAQLQHPALIARCLFRPTFLHHRPRYLSSTRPLHLADAADAFRTQLEQAPPSILNKAPAASSTPQTLTEKIVQRHSLDLAEGRYVRSGDYVTLSPYRCMTHDNSWPVATKFMSIGAEKINDPQQIVMTLDHDVQNKSEKNLKKYAQIESFAKSQGVDFYGAGRGIGHQIMVEEGYAWPGSLCVASDSHSNMYGGVACLGTPVVRTDAASIWATGRTWWQIPPVARVNLTGILPEGVTGKDVIVALCGLFNNDEVLNHCIEFTGSLETMRSLPIDDRLAIANMTTEWGALSGLFPIDDVLKGWLRAQATQAAMYSDPPGDEPSTASPTSTRFTHQALDELLEEPLQADKDAKYAKELFLDLSSLSPYVSGPNSVKVATPLAELEQQNIKVNKAYLVSCTNSRRSDIAQAARVFREASTTDAEGNVTPAKIADGVKFYIAAASLPEQQAAMESGDWQILVDAGAQVLPSGCGPCIGLGTGLLEPGEVGISASNRNFKGRMGSTEAKAYLGSPEVVAASALKGKLAGPGWYESPANGQGVRMGNGDGIKEEDRMITIEDALDRLVRQAEEAVAAGERTLSNDESDSREGVALKPDGTSLAQDNESSADGLTEILSGFPETISGELVWCNADNVNTDAIYPGKYTYDDAFSSDRSKMATVTMENYDPEFAQIAKSGDILVSGFNFGCGSSREQAATAILAKGIPLVVAGSFGNIFSRNSINNALMGVEVPKLVERLRDTFDAAPPSPAASKPITEPSGNADLQESLDTPKPAETAKPKQLTIRTGWTLTWDLRRSKVVVFDRDGNEVLVEEVGSLPPGVQDIVANGGLEGWVRKEIGKAA